MKFYNPKPTEMQEVLAAIEEAAGYYFHDLQLLKSALVHSSYAAEEPLAAPGNERLEFLGDAVLQLIVTKGLYLAFPEVQEGELTRRRSLLVDEDANARNCIKLKIDRGLMLGHGENITGGRQRKGLLGDAFEAFLGAVYLDGGYDAAAGVVQRLITDIDALVKELETSDNPKGNLQVWAQAQHHCLPEYRAVETRGPCHAPVFAVEVFVNGECLGRGEGASKKTAEQAAAKEALAKLTKAADAATAEELPATSGE